MDPYKVLGVGSMETMDEIKAEYRRLSKKYHPDKNTGDEKAEEMFKEIASAYEILSDPEKRKMFDEYGFVTTEAAMLKKSQALIQQAFQTIVKTYGLERVLVLDVMAELRSMMDQGITEVERRAAEAKTNIGLVEQLLKKFTFKNANNPIKTMLDHDIETHKKTIGQMNGEKIIAKRTYSMLKDYTFDSDTAQFKAINFGVGPSSFTKTIHNFSM